MLRVVVWLLVLAALVYLTFWVIDRRVTSDDIDDDEPRPARKPQRPHPPTGGPVGPDDDDEFLRELDRRHRDGS